MSAFHDYLKQYESKIQNSSIEVGLVHSEAKPFQLAVSSARTCYSNSGIVYPDDILNNPQEKQIAGRIAESTMKSGHLTTRQHAHFVFTISGVSRHLIWQMLHFHPFYNSEQVSQRYVQIKNNKKWYHTPESLDAESGNGLHLFAYESYQKWIEELFGVVEKEYFRIHKIRARNPSRFRKDIEKKAMEIARYVLPISTHSYLYHTISNLMLLRYFYMFHQYPGDEFRVLVLKMLHEVNKVHPEVVDELPPPIEAKERIEEDTELVSMAEKKNESFDAQLKGEASRLIEYPKHIETQLSLLPGFEKTALFDTVNHSENPFLKDVYYPVHLDPMSSLLNQYHLTFQRKISHTADSQAQRHRTLYGTRPTLFKTLSLKPDFIVPALISKNSGLNKTYHNYMDRYFTELEKIYRNGVPLSDIVYLLPNAYPIRYFESGSILHFFHKWKTRTCLNAQEEIFQSSLSDLRQLKDKVPDVYRFTGPPCVIREGAKPRCPEGSHFCGVKVWQSDYLNLDRII